MANDTAFPRPCPDCRDGLIGEGRRAHDCASCLGTGRVLCVICRAAPAAVDGDEATCLACDAAAPDEARFAKHLGHAEDLLRVARLAG